MSEAGQTREPLDGYAALAGKIDYFLAGPQLSENQVRSGCSTAANYEVAAVVVRPSDIDLAIRTLRGTDVKVAAVAGFPHGGSTTAAKLSEARDAIRRGAAEIDVVVNIGKLVSRQFPYVDTELTQLAAACREQGAALKVILETAYLTLDLKLIACKIAKKAQADFVQTRTGYSPGVCTPEEVQTLFTKCAGRAKVKAMGGVRTLEGALALYQAGADRIGTAHPEIILDAWRKRLVERDQQQVSQVADTVAEGGA